MLLLRRLAGAWALGHTALAYQTGVRVWRWPRPPWGFNLLDCADLDEAIEASAKHLIARFGVIELRPIA
jgi:hypothetical protein